MDKEIKIYCPVHKTNELREEYADGKYTAICLMYPKRYDLCMARCGPMCFCNRIEGHESDHKCKYHYKPFKEDYDTRLKNR